MSSDPSAIVPFKEKIQQIMEGKSLTLEQMYNCDKTGLCYRMQTLAKKSEKYAKGMKKQKDRVTLMACSNASGSHKLPLVFIHKSKKPRCFKNVNMSALPVKYSSQRNAWMDTEIFVRWFHEEFVPSVRKHLTDRGLEPTALLLLDNAPSHPDETKLVSKDGKIVAMYMPPNTTPLIQPMDQGVLQNLKKHYRKSLLRKLLMADAEGLSMVAFVKTINIKDVVYMIADAWENLLASTLSKSWLNILGSSCMLSPESEPETSNQDESCESLLQQVDDTLTPEEVEDWLNVDLNDPGYQLATDDEIIQQVSQCTPTETSDTEDEDISAEKIINCGEAADMLEKCLKWYEEQKEATATNLMVLKGVRDLACKKRYSNLTQRTLGSFFQ